MWRDAGFALLALLTLVLFAGCDQVLSETSTNDGVPEEGSAVRGFTTGVGELAEATVGASATAGRTTTATRSVSEEEVEKAEPAFVAGGRAGGGAGRKANRILAVRFGEHQSYDRVVVDFGTGDEPARKTPEWALEGPVENGVLQLTFPSVEETGVSDGSLGGALLKSFFVVRAPDEGMFVDVFVREGFRYRVLDLQDPARLVVDFRPSGDPLETSLPARGGNTVLVEPRRGTTIQSPFTVSGYSRNPEAANSIALRNATGDVMARKLVQANDWTATWGYFETTLASPSFGERGILRAGARSARNGAFEGVEVPVRESRK
ncbi:MAG: Gmad2 immunoglobulin-like domain-containing protein [Rubrobacteraceae bacterium]